MFQFKHVSRADLRALILNTSEKMGVNEVIVEKDYWVCFVLNYLFSECRWKDSFTFKGGTSLSKCFGLINRFSEDVDLILDWRIIGCSLNEPWQQRSKTKQDQFNKESNHKTETFLKDTLIPQMKADLTLSLGDGFDITIDANDPQTVLFEYPNAFNPSYLTQAVRLEIGTLAAWSPSKVVGIRPDIQKYYPALFEGDLIEVRTVLPERTFWEKATILHHEAHRPKELAMPGRYARHYYDLYSIGNSSCKDKALKDLDLLKKVVEFKQKFYPRNWARYDEATAATIRLVPDQYRFQEIRLDYANMSEMFVDDYPGFEQVMSGISALEAEIHEIAKSSQ